MKRPERRQFADSAMLIKAAEQADESGGLSQIHEEVTYAIYRQY